MSDAAPETPLRTVFAGTPSFAAHILEKLCGSAYRPVAVFTLPQRSSGKKGKGGAVLEVAQSHHIPVQQPAHFKTTDNVALLTNYRPGVFIVAAYGLILPPSVLTVPTIDCLNVHASLLPRWRGAAPIERAIMAGDKQTGVCIMSMEKGLDTGPVYATEVTSIAQDTDILSLEQSLAESGGDLLVSVLDEFARARAQNSSLPQPVPQLTEGVTYAKKIGSKDRQINWQGCADDVALQVRALASRDPVRSTVNVNDKTIGIQIVEAEVIDHSPYDKPAGTIVATSKAGIDVQCATKILRIKKLRFEKGKGSLLTPADALNGNANLVAVGLCLS